MHPEVIYDIPVTELQHPADTILTVFADTILIGCIRYHHIACDIHIVDCFCVHPQWRRKGVGDYLLHELHHMMRDKPNAIFIKEGAPLPIIPLYASTYVYRELNLTQISPHITTISITIAYNIMDIHQQFRPFFMLRNRQLQQTWKMYRRHNAHILCCVQDTYQRLHGKKMGQLTAWIESPGLTDAMRIEASYQLTDSMYPQFDMIWMDANWCSAYGDKWIQDGPFYWYTYQWRSYQPVERSYCFIE